LPYHVRHRSRTFVSRERATRLSGATQVGRSLAPPSSITSTCVLLHDRLPIHSKEQA